ncbi:hypothetical protein SUGI_0194690 [Cryptomeria japonica]|nr:hypothetical protein SUGI_0194690 [Cryptomeria japonica]
MVWLKKMNDRFRLPTVSNEAVMAAKTNDEPIPQPCQMEPEMDNPDRVAIPNQILVSPVGSQTVNAIDDCTVESDTCNSDPEEEEDVLNNLDPKCISQSANTLLGRAKGVKGRKSNRQIREEKATEKGIVSVLNFMKNSKGGSPSLGQK